MARREGGDAMTTEAALELACDRVDEEHEISGVVLVSRASEIIFEKAYGRASRQLDVPNSIDTKFHIASVTKMFIAMAALVLHEEGHLDFQEKPATYMPELAALGEEITLHHLLSHTSGLRDVYDVPHLRFEMSKLKYEHGDALTYLTGLPRLFAAGERWSYSSTGYILMGYLMERVTGMPYAELLRHLVFGPLAMTETGVDDPRRINAGRAYGHTVYDGQMVNAANDRLSGVDTPGELYSTAHDLKRWCDALFDHPLVSPETLRLAFTPHGRVNPDLDYGYGWFLASRFRMHGGQTPGFLAHVRQYPEQKASVIVLLNSDHVGAEVIARVIDPYMAG
jgi:CubicO group peptidase (beta-lactamase class C family)